LSCETKSIKSEDMVYFNHSQFCENKNSLKIRMNISHAMNERAKLSKKIGTSDVV